MGYGDGWSVAGGWFVRLDYGCPLYKLQVEGIGYRLLLPGLGHWKAPVSLADKDLDSSVIIPNTAG
jgi:hypothetical protein